MIGLVVAVRLESAAVKISAVHYQLACRSRTVCWCALKTQDRTRRTGHVHRQTACRETHVTTTSRYDYMLSLLVIHARNQYVEVILNDSILYFQNILLLNTFYGRPME